MLLTDATLPERSRNRAIKKAVIFLKNMLFLLCCQIISEGLRNSSRMGRVSGWTGKKAAGRGDLVGFFFMIKNYIINSRLMQGTPAKRFVIKR